VHIIKSQAEHEQLIEAMRKGDAESAEKIMFEHVIATKRRVHSLATVR
jgi:GntR family transcriptional regulator of vanillate catabolism